MIEKVKIKKMDGNFYDYTINVMGREVVLLTSEEFIQLYNLMTDIIVDDGLVD